MLTFGLMRLDRLTTKTREALMAAQRDATERKNPELVPAHFLTALINQRDGVAAAILQKAGAEPRAVAGEVAEELPGLPQVDGGAEPAISRHLKALLTAAWAETEKLKDEYTSGEHVLLAAVGQDDTSGAFANHGVTRDVLLGALKQVRGTQRVTDPDPEGTYEALEKYTRDLTEAARNGKIDPVIGRDEEIRRVMQVLSRRTKNNPVLIGEPGVGKTAMVEGLAYLQINAPEQVPYLKDKLLIELNMGSLLSGTQLRGAFSERMAALRSEVEDAEGTIIVFSMRSTPSSAPARWVMVR